MPSDDLARQAFAAVSARMEAFRAAIALTAGQLQATIEGQRAAAAGGPRPASTLGKFAAGRIDSGLFGQLLGEKPQADAARLGSAQRALATLKELQARGEELFRLRVEPGGDLRAAVDRALADAGRAFAATRLVAIPATACEPRDIAEGFPFRRWSRAERNLAPPLVIEVDGGDMMVAGLGDYLDGNQAFVLLVEGRASVAPLARLIGSGAAVVQTADAQALTQVAAFTGPMVMALVPPGSANFRFAPATANAPAQMEASDLPAQQPRRPLGGLSVFQQQQELRLLASLAAPAPVADAPSPAPEPAGVAEAGEHRNGRTPVAAAVAVDPIDALTNLLLAQIDLSDLEGREN